MDIFQQLGQEIENKWRRLNYDESLLPSLAADGLRRADLPSKTNVWEVVEWALAEAELPRQRDLAGKFGDPPLTVYSGLRFHIDIYFWFEGTTAIHQHGFCGAFQVMHGSSIHSWYDFERERSVNKFLEIGKMSLRKCELLTVGDVQEILPGRAYIHSLFHLDQPSVTIVVRTDRSPLELPQYSYFKPSLAIDPYFEQDTITKKTQLIAALIRAKNPDADKMIAKWLADSDLQTAIGLLFSLRQMLKTGNVEQLFGLDTTGDRFTNFVEIVEANQGIAKGPFREVFERLDMIDKIVERRSYVTEPEHRFFLALLLNVDGRDQVFALIRQRFPDADPLDRVLDWTQDLANTRVVSVEGNNALGIPDFGDVDLLVLEQMLLGKTGNAIVAELRSQYGDTTEGLLDTLDEKEARIRAAAIFRALFS